MNLLNISSSTQTDGKNKVVITTKKMQSPVAFLLKTYLPSNNTENHVRPLYKVHNTAMRTKNS